MMAERPDERRWPGAMLLKKFAAWRTQNADTSRPTSNGLLIARAKAIRASRPGEADAWARVWAATAAEMYAGGKSRDEVRAMKQRWLRLFVTNAGIDAALEIFEK